MLMLSRRVSECVMIGEEIVLRVVGIRGDKVRLGFEAPPHVKIDREEIAVRIAAGSRQHRGDESEGAAPGQE